MANSPSNALTTAGLISLAWGVTGGWRAFLRSGDTWITTIVWLLCFQLWTTAGWWERVNSILPNLLGFTLGGFAIFLSFGSDDFKDVLADENPNESIYVSTSSAFLVFVLVQVCALLYANVAEALCKTPIPNYLVSLEGFILTFGRPVTWGIGFWIFLYGIVLAMRAAIRVYRLSRWHNMWLVQKQKQRQRSDEEADR